MIAQQSWGAGNSNYGKDLNHIRPELGSQPPKHPPSECPGLKIKLPIGH